MTSFVAAFFPLVYDVAMWPAERLCLGRLRRRLLKSAQGQILEIGAGTGANLKYYGPDHVVMTEPDRQMLRRARVHQPWAVLARAEELPFPAGSFDAVVLTLVLCTVNHPPTALAEIRRVLRRGGALLLLEHVRSLNPGCARWQDRLTPTWSRIARNCHLNRDTLHTVQAAGFKVRSVESVEPLRLFPLILVEAECPGDQQAGSRE